MTELEPTIPDLGISSVTEDELSVEEVAETDAEEMAESLQGDLTEPTHAGAPSHAEPAETITNGKAVEAPRAPARPTTTEPMERPGRVVTAAVQKRTVSGRYVGQQYSWQLTVLSGSPRRT